MAERPGASIAVVTESAFGQSYVLAIQRDENPSIAYPGWWELPGGTLEEGETPEIGATRECYEELSIEIDPLEIHGNDRHLIEGESNATLVVAIVALEKALKLKLGDEGQACEIIELNAFFKHPDVIPEHRMRLQRYISSLGHGALSQCMAIAS